MKNIISFILTISSIVFFSQSATDPSDVTKALELKRVLQENSLVKNVAFKNIGPTVMSGRVADVDVNPENPTEFYVGYASGGLWYTNNNGTSFIPVMDTSDTQNIGDIAVDWNKGTIWVGTGEKNSSRSSYAGIGILKSEDKGKTWKNMGLLDSHHISRILINPKNPNEVVVAVIGHLYSPNKERGIFRTTNGGKSWENTLFIDENTGVIDIDFAPNNFSIMYAASWQRDRKAWNFVGEGSKSGIYKSTNAGKTWSLISENNGFPQGDGVGRIGLAVYNEDTVYTLHDSQFRRPKGKENTKKDGLTKDDFKTMTNDEFLKLDDKELDLFLKSNGFQEKYRAKNVKQMISVGVVKPVDLASYLEDANAMLFDTEVIGAEVFKTTNGGKTWQKTHKDFLDGVYFSYGYYFGEIRVDLQDESKIYVLGVPVIKSADGGKTFSSISKENVHSDHQAMWVNPKKSGHILNGNDGGLNLTYDDGENWSKLNSPAVGQFYAVYADNQKNYHVYGGLQDNGVWVAAHNSRINSGWHQSGQNPYTSIMGGDGMQVQVDERNQNIVYTGYQFGNYFRIDRQKNEQKYIQPKHELGENPYRFNWQTPILLSTHNQDILYLGGNKLHRSMDKGDTWATISDDLTTGGKKGNVAYGTLTSISESPFQFGLIYVGSDDGLVHVTKNGGGDWMKISENLPENLWVSRVVASAHKKERVYVTLNGYRWDDFKSYIYLSDDYGKTWQNIAANMPISPVNVIKEDPVNENILYVGTDNGTYITFNKGNSWEAFSKDLPNVAVHDLVIQAKAKHLVLGTHGRSLYIADIASLQEMTQEVLDKNIYIFDIESLRFSNNWGRARSMWREASEPELLIPFYSNSFKKMKITILKDDTELFEKTIQADQGYNEFLYDLTLFDSAVKELEKLSKTKIMISDNGKFYLPKGDYKIKIDGLSKEFKIL